jgi:DNA-binding beta-propeller fold protein YncE
MKPSLLFPFALAGFLAAAGNRNSSLKLVVKTDLPGISGGVDHLAIDPAGQPLLLAAEDNGTWHVIDLKTYKLARTVKGFRTPRSILCLAEASELYAANPSKAVQVLDANTFQVKKSIPATSRWHWSRRSEPHALCRKRRQRCGDETLGHFRDRYEGGQAPD